MLGSWVLSVTLVRYRSRKAFFLLFISLAVGRTLSNGRLILEFVAYMLKGFLSESEKTTLVG